MLVGYMRLSSADERQSVDPRLRGGRLVWGYSLSSVITVVISFFFASAPSGHRASAGTQWASRRPVPARRRGGSGSGGQPWISLRDAIARGRALTGDLAQNRRSIGQSEGNSPAAR